MNRRFFAALTAACLLLTGCSSDAGDSPTPASPHTPNTPAASSDEAFCDALLTWGVETEAMSVAMSELGNLVSEIDDPADLPSPDVLHDFAEAVLGSADAADAAMTVAISQTDDPEAAAQFAAANEVMLDLARWTGGAARDAEDVLGFATVVFGNMEMIEGSTAFFETFDGSAADAYARDRCGFLPGYTGGAGAGTEDTKTMSAVGTLGKEIATYYVDSEPGVAPIITIVDGDFYLLDTNIGPASPYFEVTDQYYLDSTDWCVELTNSMGDVPTFRYTPFSGLEAGTCAQL